MQESRDSIKDIWGSRTPYVGDWPVRIDEHIEDTPDHWVPSACMLCSNGCGIDIGVKNGRIVEPRSGSLALLRDLHDLWLMSNEAELCCLVLKQAASGLHDQELLNVCNSMEQQTKRQTAWLLTRIKSAAPQILIAAK